MTIDCNDSHPPNAPSSMSSRDCGRKMDFNSMQPLNADSLICVTPSGMVILSKKRQLAKAASPIVVTLEGMEEPPHPATSMLNSVSIMALQLSRESKTLLAGLTTMLFRL